MMRHEHVVALGQRVVERQAVEGAGLVVQDDDGRALAGARKMQLGPQDVELRVGPANRDHAAFPPRPFARKLAARAAAVNLACDMAAPRRQTAR
jgi:hypothetical protein